MQPFSLFLTRASCFIFEVYESDLSFQLTCIDIRKKRAHAQFMGNIFVHETEVATPHSAKIDVVSVGQQERHAEQGEYFNQREQQLRHQCRGNFLHHTMTWKS